MEIDRKTLTVVAATPAIVVATIGALAYLDERHAQNAALDALEVEVIRRDAISDHTRWGQIVHHYSNVQKERPLTKAEEQRLDLAKREIDRLTHKLLGDE